LLLREGLGLDSYPYGPGIGAQSPPPANGAVVSGKRHAPPKNIERRVTYPPPPKRNFRGRGSSSQAGPVRAGPSQVRAAAYVDLDAPAAATLPPPQVVHRGSLPAAAAAVVTPLEPPASAEPFHAANLREDFCRGRSVPEQCTRGLLTMFPPVGADIWDVSPVVAVIALAEVLARVSRRVSTLAVDVYKARQPALAQRLINDWSGRALGDQLRVQLSTTLSELPTYGSGCGSTSPWCRPPPRQAATTPVVESPRRPGSIGTTLPTMGGRRRLRRRTMGRPGGTATVPAPLRVGATPRRCGTTPTGRCTAPRALVLAVVPLITTRIRGAATTMITAATCSREGRCVA